MIFIQEVLQDEIPAFWEAHLRYLIDDEIITDPEEIDYFSGRDYRGVLEAHMKREPDRHHMIYFTSDDVKIGAAHYTTFQSEDGKCFILDFWVFPAFRNQGLGTRCYELLEDQTKKDGAAYYELNSIKADSIRFWKRRGFVENGVDEYGMKLFIKR